MKSKLFSFAWDVYPGGYRTIRGERQDNDEVEEALIEDLPIEANPKIEKQLIDRSTDATPDPAYRSYSPLEEQTGLFRLFAELETSESAITAFANRFGLLGVADRHHYRVFDENEPFHQGGNGEPLSVWRREITYIKMALGLWDLLRKTRTRQARLEEVVRAILPIAEVPEQPDFYLIVGRVAPPGGSRAIDQAERDAFVDQFEQKQWRPAGWFLLQRMLDVRLQEFTAPRLHMQPGDNHPTLSITPRTLLGAIWLQFANAVSGQLKHRVCKAEECGEWFEISKRQEGYRKNREYCSDACRMRTHRKRKAQARRLAGEGRSVGEIAELLGSGKKAIRGWIGKKPLRVVR